MNHPDVLHLLQPLPLGSSSKRDGDVYTEDLKRQRRNKGDPKGKGKGSLSLRIPQGLEKGTLGPQTIIRFALVTISTSASSQFPRDDVGRACMFVASRDATSLGTIMPIAPRMFHERDKLHQSLPPLRGVVRL